MRMEVKKEIDAETREVYSFNLFDLTAVFIGWRKEVKPKGKRKWVTELWWNTYERSCNAPQPELPYQISVEAAEMVKNMIKVKTWSEWKSL